MRSSKLGTALIALFVTTVAASGSAGESVPAQPSPTTELAPKVRVAGFHRPHLAGYMGGALRLAIDVENKSFGPAKGITVKLDTGAQVLTQTVDIPAFWTQTVWFNDPAGLGSCAPKTYSVSLAGPSANTAPRTGRVTPYCEFSTQIEQTWNVMTPDRVEAEKSGNVYLSSPTVVSPSSCASGPSIKVRAVSNSPKSSSSLIVQAKEFTARGQVTAQTAAAFPLASKEQREVVLAPLANKSTEPTAKLKLGIVDWTKSLAGRTSDGGIFVNTTRNCTLAFKMD